MEEKYDNGKLVSLIKDIFDMFIYSQTLYRHVTATVAKSPFLNEVEKKTLTDIKLTYLYPSNKDARVKEKKEIFTQYNKTIKSFLVANKPRADKFEVRYNNLYLSLSRENGISDLTKKYALNDGVIDGNKSIKC